MFFVTFLGVATFILSYFIPPPEFYILYCSEMEKKVSVREHSWNSWTQATEAGGSRQAKDNPGPLSSEFKATLTYTLKHYFRKSKREARKKGRRKKEKNNGREGGKERECWISILLLLLQDEEGCEPGLSRDQKFHPHWTKRDKRVFACVSGLLFFDQ